MPIKGLTDNNAQTFGAGFPRIATLYKGDEKPAEGNRPGADLTHFRIEFEPEFEYLREDWYEMYTETPEEFPMVFLAQSTVDEAFSTWKEEWNASQTLLRRCDGEYQKIHYDQKTGIHNHWRADCLTPVPPTPPAEPACKCKPVGRLNLIFPEFIELTGVLGYITMATHSIHDLMTLHRYLTDLFKIQGNLMGIPLVFGRSIREISTPVTDKAGKRTGARRKNKKSLLYLRATADYTKQVLLPTLATPRTEAPALSARAETVKEISLLTAGQDIKRIVGREPEPEPTLTVVSGTVVILDAEEAIVELHWSQDEIKHQIIVQYFEDKLGISESEALKLVGKSDWLDFETGQYAVNKVMAALDDAVQAEKQAKTEQPPLLAPTGTEGKSKAASDYGN